MRLINGVDIYIKSNISDFITKERLMKRNLRIMAGIIAAGTLLAACGADNTQSGGQSADSDTKTQVEEQSSDESFDEQTDQTEKQEQTDQQADKSASQTQASTKSSSAKSDSAQSKSSQTSTKNSSSETASDADSVYIGEYLDADVNEPNLEIAKREDGKYTVQLGIYRLTTLTDGVGEMTSQGITFTATDDAGNPIKGLITVSNKTATVTFTDSTWDYLPNGSTFKYTKSSDTPNVQDYGF